MKGLILIVIILASLFVIGCSSQESNYESVDVGELYVHPGYNHTFSDEQLQSIKKLELTLKEVYPISYEEWIDMFNRDRHPEREIDIWIYIAEVYEKAIPEFPDNFDYHNDVFEIILLCSMGDDDYVRSAIEPEKLTQEEVDYVISLYTREPEPITVVKIEK